MTKQEITKEILISAFYLGKYLIQKHKLKKKQKLEEAESNKKQPVEKKDENSGWRRLGWLAIFNLIENKAPNVSLGFCFHQEFTYKDKHA